MVPVARTRIAVRHPRPAGRPERGGGRFEVMPAFDESYKSSMCGGGRVASTSTLVSTSAPTRKNPMTDRVAAAVGYTRRWRISGGGTSHSGEWRGPPATGEARETVDYRRPGDVRRPHPRLPKGTGCGVGPRAHLTACFGRDASMATCSGNTLTATIRPRLEPPPRAECPRVPSGSQRCAQTSSDGANTDEDGRGSWAVVPAHWHADSPIPTIRATVTMM